MKDEMRMTEKELDAALEESGQSRIQSLVRGLPEETLSLAWRSELNRRLLAADARRRRLVRLGWIWKPAAGLAAAFALSLAYVSRLPMERVQGPEVERALVNNYIETAATRDVAADGVTSAEAKEQAASVPSFDLEPEDVGATL